MPQYLVAIHHPDDYDPSVEDEAMPTTRTAKTRRWLRSRISGRNNDQAAKTQPRAELLGQFARPNSLQLSERFERSAVEA